METSAVNGTDSTATTTVGRSRWLVGAALSLCLVGLGAQVGSLVWLSGAKELIPTSREQANVREACRRLMELGSAVHDGDVDAERFRARLADIEPQLRRASRGWCGAELEIAIFVTEGLALDTLGDSNAADTAFHGARDLLARRPVGREEGDRSALARWVANRAASGNTRRRVEKR